jgi:hypothetical protein|tara:strand:+ start:302 stop:1021 length:720 start_codon:yes stop_codon:yes gene_type:complete
LVTSIDITFNVYSDTPSGKDPDSYSPTLRSYHMFLWSKPLPNKVNFALNDKTSKLLHHQSDLGEFFLSSDSIGHTYGGGPTGYKVKSVSHILDQVAPDEIERFFNVCCTIGAYIIFPSKRIDNKPTINGARGLNHKIKDRFDLTLECIRRYYKNEDSPLKDTLSRYSKFFNLFESFQGYVDFFLLQDLVLKDYSEIKFWLPFNNFHNSPLPTSVDEYIFYSKNVTNFVIARNQRIQNLK